MTFSGSALPSVLVIGLFRLLVCLYELEGMLYAKCQWFSHAALYCRNKPRCSMCGEEHTKKCATCGQSPPHELNACPKYPKRKKRNINSLKQRSRRPYAEMLKGIAPVAVPLYLDHPSTSNNIFASLSDDDQGSDCEDGEECMSAL